MRPGFSLLMCCLSIVAGIVSPLTGAEPQSHRIDIHVDHGRPIAGERSRFAVSPKGDIFFTYTLTAGDFSCKPLGIISPAGEIQMSAIDSESTWNVEGWGTYGQPFDLMCDVQGALHVAVRHRGPPYGVDYWRQVDGTWRLETFGADVTHGGNNVSLDLLPEGSPIVVCQDRDRSRLTVWERSETGGWQATRPPELTQVAPGEFDLDVDQRGTVRVVFCPASGGPKCATRNEDGQWTLQQIAPTSVSRMIALTNDVAGRLHVSFASGDHADRIQTLNYATLAKKDAWQARVVATSNKTGHVGKTDISADGSRIVITWEQGTTPVFAPKDYGGSVGSVMLSVIDDKAATHQLVSENGGRPSVALSPDGHTVWVGVYTGNAAGDDFYLLNCRLDGTKPPATRVLNGDPADIFRAGCLKDIDSGNEQAERRGLQRIEMGGLDAAKRNALIARYWDHHDPLIRLAIVSQLAQSPDSVAHFALRLPDVLGDSDSLVRKALLEGLAVGTAEQQFLRPVFAKAITSRDAMTRLSAAEVLRDHIDWIDSETRSAAWSVLMDDLKSTDATAAGSAAMALERLIDTPDVPGQLRSLIQTGTPSQRVRAALVLFRCGQELDWSQLRGIPSSGDEQAELSLCGLLGQARCLDGVPLLKQALQSQHAAVRNVAVFALRSTAHVAELKPVAKHPNGFDILALRVVAPEITEQRRTQQAAILILVDALEHTDPNVRQKACDALNRVEAKQAVTAIQPLLNDPDSGVRISARTALGILGDRPNDVLIDLKRWGQTKDERPSRRVNPVSRAPSEVVNGVVQVGIDKQLLIDDFVIEEKRKLKRRLHAFQKHPRNPVFQAQVPWEEGWADPFMSTVIYDPAERAFKMWYRCGPRHSLKGYAVSSDGVHWERPDIAESDWQEFPRHNLLGFEGEIATWKKPGNNVQFFPNASGTDRFLSLFYQPATSDFAQSRSADGVNWLPPQSVRPAYGDVVSLVWDRGRQQYLFFPKYSRENDGFVRRSFAAATLKTVGAPFSPAFPFLAGHQDDSRVADNASRAYGSLLKDTMRLRDFHSEIYSVTAIPYEGAVVALYDLWSVIGNAEGPLEMPMKVSRDMKSWEDVDAPRRALSIGQFGEWDSGMVYGGNTMLVVDDEIHLYYLGANMGHCTRVLPMTKPYHSLGVGLATLRLDGFASLQAEAEQGEFTTKPLQISGNRLQINGRCQAGGSIKAELIDAKGKPLPGFTLDDCEAFVGDSIAHTLKWKSKAAIPSMTEPVRLRIVMTSADLFAFQFPSDSKTLRE